MAQSIGVSASASVFPVNIQDWFHLGFTGLISLKSKDSQESSLTPQFKSINSLGLSLLYGPTLTSIHDCCKSMAFLVHRLILFAITSYIDVTDKLALAKSICQWLNNNKSISHLPLWRLNPVLLQLLTFNTVWQSSACSEALCSRKSGGTGLSVH